jgi:hypothetical protein
MIANEVLLMWWFVIKIIEFVNKLSRIINAINFISKIYTWVKRHKNDIKNCVINACLKIFEWFDLKKKNCTAIN